MVATSSLRDASKGCDLNSSRSLTILSPKSAHKPQPTKWSSEPSNATVTKLVLNAEGLIMGVFCWI